METFCIIYETMKGGRAEFFVHATSASAARTLFQQERIEGNLDNPATGQIIELYRL